MDHASADLPQIILTFHLAGLFSGSNESRNESSPNTDNQDTHQKRKVDEYECSIVHIADLDWT
ncbi:MAG: hypothetical protein O2857_19315 [Planctomycetota bacterium]|nr:hypothetical protein [Planctomycetota bacterium]